LSGRKAPARQKSSTLIEPPEAATTLFIVVSLGSRMGGPPSQGISRESKEGLTPI
jgi:hypothetical protein